MDYQKEIAAVEIASEYIDKILHAKSTDVGTKELWTSWPIDIDLKQKLFLKNTCLFVLFNGNKYFRLRSLEQWTNI